MFTNSPEKKLHFSEYFNLFYGCSSKPPSFSHCCKSHRPRKCSCPKMHWNTWASCSSTKPEEFTHCWSPHSIPVLPEHRSHKPACTNFSPVPSIPMTFYLFICRGGEHRATCGHHGNGGICWLYSFPWCMENTIGKQRDTWAKVSWLEGLELVERTLKF